MILHSYFDGANKPDLKLYDRVVLASACGTGDQWAAFQAEWREVIDRHNHAPFLHATDAVSLRDVFSKDQGWDDNSVDDLILDCVRVIRRHMAKPSLNSGEFSPGLRIITLTIYLEDYKRARANIQKLPNSVTDICTSESLSFCFKWGSKIGANWYHLYFDQGEPFYGHTLNRWKSKKARMDVPMLERVLVVSEANMRIVPALQLADLFAWCISHNDNPSKRLWHRALNDLPWESLELDHNLLLKPTPEALERMTAWNMPRRRPAP